MKYIYIDGGAYDGDSIEQFRNWIKLDYGEQDWIIHAFEPNPVQYEKLKAYENDKTFIYPDALWNKDGEIEFAVDNSKTPLGSTLMKSKKAIWDNNDKIRVKAVDLSNFIKQFKDDVVMLKLDVEGAEFEILGKMIKDGTDLIPETIMCEFHPNKVLDYTTTDKLNLIKKLKDRGVRIIEWH